MESCMSWLLSSSVEFLGGGLRAGGLTQEELDVDHVTARPQSLICSSFLEKGSNKPSCMQQNNRNGIITLICGVKTAKA